MESFEAKDNNKDEEDLFRENAKLYVLIVGSHDTFPDISKVLRKHVHTVNHLITLSNSVRN